jgi:hypothetical protein
MNPILLKTNASHGDGCLPATLPVRVSFAVQPMDVRTSDLDQLEAMRRERDLAQFELDHANATIDGLRRSLTAERKEHERIAQGLVQERDLVMETQEPQVLEAGIRQRLWLAALLDWRCGRQRQAERRIERMNDLLTWAMKLLRAFALAHHADHEGPMETCAIWTCAQVHSIIDQYAKQSGRTDLWPSVVADASAPQGGCE